jgi:parallel beta-helix repeat protein
MPSRPPPRRPRLEPLEAREVPSGSHHVLDVRQGDPHARYQTIQAAVEAARPGDEVRVSSGTYREAVRVTTPGLTIDGAPGAQVVIANPGGADDGVTAAGAPGAPLDGFTLAGVTLRGFDGDGAFLLAVRGFVLRDVRAEGNALYGLYPLLSSRGLIERCVASGSDDSGIYVGQSADVAVRGDVAYGNVNGIEVENSSGVRVAGNVVFGNTVGILVDLLPAAVVAVPGFAPVESSADNVVAGNLVFANNRPNTAPPDDIASAEPPGTGVAVVGGTHTIVRGNVVTGNAFAGVAVLSGADLLALAPGTPGYSPGVDPDATDTLVAGNVVLGNGFAPGPVPPGFPAPADLVWTGSGTGNRWRHNLFGTSSPGELP